MKHFTGYGAYLLFLALRTHFTKPNYDFFRMNGKLRATKESYYKRNDKFFFEKLAKDYNATELRDYYIANLLEEKQYITELLDDNSKQTYTDYLRRRQSLSYNYTNDLARTFRKGIREPFIVNHNAYPRIVLLFLRREISIETMVILDDFLGYTDKFDKYYEGDIVWNKVSKKVSKYRPFLEYDKTKLKDILKKEMTK
jgi:hypothetical protein